ncbi:potassium channel family protein [Bacillus salitolerans]|uniref:Potassium channel family protein n=1 Tax=Bacillus salitolerans TaxID=1437434 RepID=A0ABW4LMS6_9BACI
MRLSNVLISYLRLPIVVRVALLALFIIFLFGAIIHVVEPDNFPSYFDGIWWAIVTVSTVGYGDFSPSTYIGRIFGMLLILVGVGFMTFYFVSLSTATVTRQNSFLEGKASYNGKKHIILVGWNERIRETLHQLNGIHSRIPIVLIDETLDNNPVDYSNVTFIKGNPTYDDTLLRASITDADILIISADQSKNEVNADMATILTLIAAKGLKPNLYCIVEVLTNNQILNATRAGADEIIQTNKLSSFVMTNSIVSHGMSATLLVMLDNLAGNKFEYIKSTPNHIGKTYQACINELLEEEMLLIGIKRGDESFINPSPSFTILDADELLIIKH